jgi:putative IMPACT (imprinted ancient) family translation regulator
MKMENQRIPARESRAEISVANSHFVASLAPTFSVEEAKDFITQIKTEFADATHNVSAFVIGHGSSTIAHSNDDGEPRGTAGRPALLSCEEVVSGTQQSW